MVEGQGVRLLYMIVGVVFSYAYIKIVRCKFCLVLVSPRLNFVWKTSYRMAQLCLRMRLMKTMLLCPYWKRSGFLVSDGDDGLTETELGAAAGEHAGGRLGLVRTGCKGCDRKNQPWGNAQKNPCPPEPCPSGWASSSLTLPIPLVSKYPQAPPTALRPPLVPAGWSRDKLLLLSVTPPAHRAKAAQWLTGSKYNWLENPNKTFSFHQNFPIIWKQKALWRWSDLDKVPATSRETLQGAQATGCLLPNSLGFPGSGTVHWACCRRATVLIPSRTHGSHPFDKDFPSGWDFVSNWTENQILKYWKPLGCYLFPPNSSAKWADEPGECQYDATW